MLLGIVRLFVSATIPPDQEARLEREISALLSGKGRYESVGNKLGIPWYFIGIIHGIDSRFHFDKHLHNGDPLTGRTVRVPKGRPPVGDPPFSWEESAADALTMMRLDAATDWNVATTLLRWERSNGLGYRRRGVNSPYLWACTNHYSKGRYMSDGIFDPDAVATYCGAAAILKKLVDKGLVKLN